VQVPNRRPRFHAQHLFLLVAARHEG
jgi:hypothetical protein